MQVELIGKHEKQKRKEKNRKIDEEHGSIECYCCMRVFLSHRESCLVTWVFFFLVCFFARI